MVQKFHFISIGGSAMHNLAIALNRQHQISGSDDEIFEPSRSRLAEHGLLPQTLGWDEGRVNDKLDAIILGMHAKADNPELKKALALGIPVYSFPEFLALHSRDKKRIVVAGSHGKTTITAMVMHVLKSCRLDFDYLVGAQLDGFDVMVKLTNAPIIIIEGDEYLSSAIDPRPKFLWYKPHIAVLNGIAWDHFNVFPSFEAYKDQFRAFLSTFEPDGVLFYNASDEVVVELAESNIGQLQMEPYHPLPHHISESTYSLQYHGKNYEVPFFGNHNMVNAAAAVKITHALGIAEEVFYEKIKNFTGAARRLECRRERENKAFFKDFAHAPSKVKATVEAVKQRNPDRKLIAILELHTYSSLSQDFLPQYYNSLEAADIAMLYYSPHALSLKKLPDLQPDLLLSAFGKKGLLLARSKEELLAFLKNQNWDQSNLLMMSSGSFDGFDYSFAEKLMFG